MKLRLRLALISLFVLMPMLAWATPSATNVTASIDTTDGTDYTTASFAITADRLYLFAISAAIQTSGASITDPTITCHSMTWVKIDSIEAGQDPERAIFVFRGMKSSGSASATCAIHFAETMGRASWAVSEWTGTNTSGTNGSGAIVQSVTATGSSATCAVTLAAFSSTSNRPYSTCRVGTPNAHTQDTGWTELSQPTGTENMSHSSAWKDATDDTTNSVSVTSGTWITVAVEVAAPGQSTRSTHQYRLRRD